MHRQHKTLIGAARRQVGLVGLALAALACTGPDGDGPVNVPPTARFKATLTVEPLTAQLDAARTTDPDGDSLTYAWSVSLPPGVDAPVVDAVGPDATLVAAEPGLYLVDLTVSDARGATSTSSRALHLFDGAFPAATQTPAFGNPVYAWSARQLYFPGGTTGVLDVPAGVLATDSVQDSVLEFAIAPNGGGMLVKPLGGSVEYYDAIAGVVLGAVPFTDGAPVPADDAIYWSVNGTTGAGLAKYDLDQQQVFAATPTTDYVHPPIVSTSLGEIIVPIGSPTSVERFEIYDLGSPPTLTATIAFTMPWGRVDPLDGGDVLVVPGGPILQISRESLAVLDDVTDDYRVLAHNPTVAVFAVLDSLHVRIYSDQTFELIADYDLAGWISTVGWQRIFRHERGFMVVQTGHSRIDSLYIEP